MQRFFVRTLLLGGLALAACVPPARPVPACRPMPPQAPEPTPAPPDSLPGSGSRTAASFATGC